MDLMLFRRGTTSEKFKICTVSAPSFPITRNVVDSNVIIGINNYQDKKPTAGSIDVYGQLIRQYDDLYINGATSSSPGHWNNWNNLYFRAAGFIEIPARQYTTNESPQTIQQFNSLKIALLSRESLPEFNFTENRFAANTTLRIKYEIDSQARCRLSTTVVDQVGMKNWIVRAEGSGFDAASVVMTMGQDIDNNGSFSGAIGIVPANGLFTGKGYLIQVSYDSEATNGVNIKRVEATGVNEYTTINTTIFDSTQYSPKGIKAYQFNDITSLAEKEIESLNASNAKLTEDNKALKESMAALSQQMADLRKDVDEITDRSAALYVSR